MDHASSSGERMHPEEQYVSPLSVANMVALATSLLAHPHWGPSLRNSTTYRNLLVEVKGQVSRACPHLADACATGVALAVLPFCTGVQEKWEGLRVNCDCRISEEAVAAFYTALAQPTCKINILTIQGAAFGTPVAAAHLGRCLNVNSTIRILDIKGLHGEAVWTAFSHALTSNATTRRQEVVDAVGTFFRASPYSLFASTTAHTAAAFPSCSRGVEFKLIHVMCKLASRNSRRVSYTNPPSTPLQSQR